MDAIRHLLRKGKLPHPGTQVLEVAAQVEVNWLAVIDRAVAAGELTPVREFTYHNLVLGSFEVFKEIVSTQPFSDQLVGLGFHGKDAVLAAYVQLVCQRAWDLTWVCDSNPMMQEALGQDAESEIGLFCAWAGLDVEFMAGVVESAQRALAEMGQGVDIHPVIDLQTFEFLQTLTEGAYTKEIFAGSPLDQWREAALHVLMSRIKWMGMLRDMLGVDGPVLGLR